MMYKKYLPSTLYELLDTLNQKTMLTLRKDVADALFEVTGDVHGWLQNQYDEIVVDRWHRGFKESYW